MAPLSDGSGHEPRPSASDGLAPPEAPVGEAPTLSVVEHEPRRYPSTIGGACYLAMLGVTVLAMIVIGLGHWRGGVHLLAVVMVVASGLRAFLRRRDAGMLEVRSRWFDVSMLAAVGVALWVLASTVPDQV